MPENARATAVKTEPKIEKKTGVDRTPEVHSHQANLHAQLLQLQRTVGNRAVSNLHKSQGKKRIGSTFDTIVENVYTTPTLSIQKKDPDSKPKSPSRYFQVLTNQVVEDQRTKDPKQGNAQRKKLLDLVLAIDSGTGSADKLKKIKSLVADFNSDMDGFKPDFSIFTIMNDAFFNYTYAKYELVLSPWLADQIAARLALLGLTAESLQIRQYAKRDQSGSFQFDEPDTFYRAIALTVLGKLNISSDVAASASLDELLKGYRLLLERIAQLNSKEAMADLKSLESIIGKSSKKGEFGFFSVGGFLRSLVVRLAEVYAGMQRIVQYEMDKAVAELESDGASPSLTKIEEFLEKIRTGALVETKMADQVPFFTGSLTAPITSTAFSKSGGVHQDYFAKPGDPKAGRAKITYYDKTQKTGDDKEMSLLQIYQVRKSQVIFLKELYGLNVADPAGKQEGAVNKAVRQRAFPDGKFRLHNNDDWRKFLSTKYDYLISEQKLSKPESFLKIIQLLSGYLRVFTVSTPYNIEDFGDNYLTKTFPRALTGQLIHDCGVYALRIAYILSLLSEKLQLKIRFVLYPDHVGLVITGDGVPTLVTHNNQLIPIATSQAQLDQIGEETRKYFFRSDYMPFDKLKVIWDKKTREKNIPGPKDADQFLLEMGGAEFIPFVDMPVKMMDLPPSRYYSKKGDAAIKAMLWKQYQEMARTELFGAQTKNPDSEVFQLHLRYLKLTEEYKYLYNQKLLPVWNKQAPDIWKKYQTDLKALSQSGPSASYQIKATQYQDELKAAFEPVETAYEELREKKQALSKLVRQHKPSPLATQRVLVGERELFVYYWQIDVNMHLHNITKGVDIIPPFLPPHGFLQPLD